MIKLANWLTSFVQLRNGVYIHTNLVLYDIKCVLAESPVINKQVIVRVHLSVSSQLRARVVLMVNILNKCILSILVYELFLDSALFYIHRNISIKRYIGCLHEMEIQFFKNIQLSDWAKKYVRQ